jgi:tetratricopeptide (TPR) repeat protein
MSAILQTIHQRAQEHLNQHEYAQLASCCKEMLSIDSDFADAWFLLSVVAEAAADLPRARQLRERALELAPKNTEYLAQHSRLLSQMNQHTAALASARLAVANGDANALAFDTLGVVFTRLGHYEEARDSFAAAVNLRPENPQYHFNLATAEQFLGRVDTAASCYREAIASDPEFARAWWGLAELSKAGTAAVNLKALEYETLKHNANRDGLPTQDALYFGHAAARAYESEGDYASAFATLKKGKAGFRDRAAASRTRDDHLMSSLKKLLPERDTVLREKPIDRSTPLFIVGMPRTGTTLIERILSVHEGVVSLGETQELVRALLLSAKCTGSIDQPDPKTLTRAASEPAANVAKHYREATAARLEQLPSAGQYVVDKMPLNALYMGFILRSMPEARIVLLDRDLRDVCISNYRQLFALNYIAYDYQYDLEVTAHFIVGFRRLVDHYKQCFGRRIYTLSYETLVNNPDQEIRRLLEYLDLEWEPQCLNFEQNTAGVATASALQVRKPLYRDAVERWRLFENEIKPALAILTDAGLLP